MGIHKMNWRAYDQRNHKASYHKAMMKGPFHLTNAALQRNVFRGKLLATFKVTSLRCHLASWNHQLPNPSRTTEVSEWSTRNHKWHDKTGRVHRLEWMDGSLTSAHHRSTGVSWLFWMSLFLKYTPRWEGGSCLISGAHGMTIRCIRGNCGSRTVPEVAG